jgi:hypothetical protein
METSIVKPSTGRSMETSPVRAVNRPTKVVSMPMVATANATPTTPPAAASSVLSVSSWRTSRPRPAPSAARSASSRSRPSIRASVRFATFAHAISSTRLVMPIRMSSSSRAPSVSAERTSTVVAWKPDVAVRYTPAWSAVKRRLMVAMAAAASSCVWPSFTRPKTLSPAKARRFRGMVRSAAARNGHARTGM